MIVEKEGPPPLFEEANEELICRFADHYSGYFDPTRDWEIVQDLIVRIHQLDHMRRLKIYSLVTGKE